MKVLGISAFYHDSAAALIVDGKILAAAQEERFTRKKHDPGFPNQAIRYCLEEAGVKAIDIDAIVFYDKPFLKFERIFETYLAFAPMGFKSFQLSMPLWFRDKLFQKKKIADCLKAVLGDLDVTSKLKFSEHHLSHAASAFYPSPFEDAAVLTMDGVGEWTTTSLCYGSGAELEVLKEIQFPHSLGLLYSAFTYFCGFKVNSGEYKLMGLAPYGVPRFKEVILDHLVDVKEDGSFRLNQKYFEYCVGIRMTNRRFSDLFGVPPRQSEERLTQIYMDIAASAQAVTEEIVLKLARSAQHETKSKNLCLAGGVALNCVANGKIAKAGIFENIWIQPAAGDAGGAVGAALAYYYAAVPKREVVSEDQMEGSYLGPNYADSEIEKAIAQVEMKFDKYDDDSLFDACAVDLDGGNALGWFQGRMEYGPRALGARSIIADARSPEMQKTLNLKVKFRESFRPFAPAVLREDLEEWFDFEMDSPYMLMVSQVAEEKKIEAHGNKEGLDKLKQVRSQVPAITHVDSSARVQTVHRETNPRFHKLLESFKSQTNCPVLVNTSFNIRGEPIVNTPEDAIRCFLGTDIDCLVLGNYVVRKRDQDPAVLEKHARDYRESFTLD